MAVTRTNAGFGKNPTASDSSSSARRILAFESDAFVLRLKEVVGEESVSSFARRCGVGESTLRNVLAGAAPRADILVAIAEAGNVTVDWLATGRPPKTRSELRATLAVSQAVPCKINVDALAAVIEGALRVGRNAPAEALAAHCAKVYNSCIEEGLITPDGVGTGHLNQAA
jgi:transcriptional regulator with XRE-family HTH domain